jgi:hypothetical protein
MVELQANASYMQPTYEPTNQHNLLQGYITVFSLKRRVMINVSSPQSPLAYEPTDRHNLPRGYITAFSLKRRVMINASSSETSARRWRSSLLVSVRVVGC